MTPRECELAFSDAPITEEWLKSVGFEGDYEFFEKQIEDNRCLRISLEETFIHYCWLHDEGFEIFLRRLSKRWQLMRLWEAITDESLTTQ